MKMSEAVREETGSRFGLGFYSTQMQSNGRLEGRRRREMDRASLSWQWAVVTVRIFII